MSTEYEESGRIAQKSRTRSALIAAARALIAQGGRTPTVAEAAAAASISRTTAYRYFPSQTALLAAAHPEVTLSSLLPVHVGNDAATRLRSAVTAFVRIVIDTEQQQRTMLRLSLEPASGRPELPLRKGRAIGWFEEALMPLEGRIGEDGIRSLAIAVRSAVGIESLIWLTDIAGLTRNEAAARMVWSAEAMLRHALETGPPSRT